MKLTSSFYNEEKNVEGILDITTYNKFLRDTSLQLYLYQVCLLTLFIFPRNCFLSLVYTMKCISTSLMTSEKLKLKH